MLERAVRASMGVRLVHVGRIGDLAFPGDDDRFEHLEPVPQYELAKVYSTVDCLVLPSRQDGLAVVLAQALASGLPIICSDRTGGNDLGHTPALQQRITVVPHDDVDALRRTIEELRDRKRSGREYPPLQSSDREALSWSAYAKRYEAELLRSISGLQDISTA